MALLGAVGSASHADVRCPMQYLVVIEQGASSYGAYVPDLPGCVAVGESREEVSALIHEAIELHIEDLKARGQQLPGAYSSSELVRVEA
jgi:predicted RNase H-like HicB family nuclease